ncbi:hypothetical protein LJC14_01800 [Treponema sp. OttesenSCG-928-L16]|nr:hypothetical protein [Treponema sp. OttesenSCG-928-L16]
MTGKEIIFTTFSGGTAPRLPFVPIMMQFAARSIAADYNAYCSDYRILVQGQLHCVDTYGTDVVSVITDTAVETSDLGNSVFYSDNAPPANREEFALFRNKEDFLSPWKRPRFHIGERMTNRLKGLAELKRQSESRVFVEGWVEGPCVAAALLRGISPLMMDFFDDPVFAQDLLAYAADYEIQFALEQIKAGADGMGIGDPSSSLVGPDIFKNFILEHHKAYVKAIHDAGAFARLHICGNAEALIPLLKDVPYDVIDLDSWCSVSFARKALGPDRVLLGNIDTLQILREGTPESIRSSLEQCFLDAGKRNYFVGAGCGVPEDTPPENVLAMTEFSRSHKALPPPA